MDTCSGTKYEISKLTNNNECKESCDNAFESEADSLYEGMKICVSDCEQITLIENGQKKCVNACPSQLNGSYVYALNELNRTCVVVNNEEQ